MNSLSLRSLKFNGFALLRGAIPQQTVSRFRDAIEKIYEGTSGNGDIAAPAFTEQSGMSFNDLFSELPHPSRYTFYNGTILSVGTKHANAQDGISLHTDGIIQGTTQDVLCFWAPLHPCGVTAPGLAVVPAGKHEVIEHLRKHFSHQIPGWKSETEWNSTAAFKAETIRETFGEPYSPAMYPGDVMLFTNWTIHGSYITPEMQGKRSAAVLRLIRIPLLQNVRKNLSQLVRRFR